MTTSVVALSQRALSRARRAVSRDYPAFRRVKPQVAKRPNGTFALTFRTTTGLPDGKKLEQTLRATVNEQGELLRVVVSK
jgi:hypothetical protein